MAKMSSALIQWAMWTRISSPNLMMQDSFSDLLHPWVALHWHIFQMRTRRSAHLVVDFKGVTWCINTSPTWVIKSLVTNGWDHPLIQELNQMNDKLIKNEIGCHKCTYFNSQTTETLSCTEAWWENKSSDHTTCTTHAIWHEHILYTDS